MRQGQGPDSSAGRCIEIDVRFALHATRNPQPATAPQELFFTGKPYLEETGQYLFLFRHYDSELARWTTADPSGFPDGANNIAYMAVPTSQFDWQGLAKLSINVFWSVTTLREIRDSSGNIIQRGHGFNRSEVIDVDYSITGNFTRNPVIHVPGSWSYSGQPIRTFINGVLSWGIGPIDFSLSSIFKFTTSNGVSSDGNPWTDINWTYTNGGSVSWNLTHGDVTLPVNVTIIGGDIVARGTDRIYATKE